MPVNGGAVANVLWIVLAFVGILALAGIALIWRGARQWRATAGKVQIGVGVALILVAIIIA